MSQVSENINAGDNIAKSWGEQAAKNANDGGGFRDDINAGEAINGATLPVAVYINTSDNEVYACDGNDSAKLEFIGFAISNSTDGNPISIQCSGIVRGFTGLAEGQKYYVQDDKTIGTTAGAYSVLVGIAKSETELLIVRDLSGIYELSASDNLKTSSDAEAGTTETSYTKLKEIKVRQRGIIRIKFDVKTLHAGDLGYGQIYINGVAAGTQRTNNTTTYSTFSEDLTVVVGDLIQLYLKGTAGYESRCQNFRLYWNKSSVADYTVIT